MSFHDSYDGILGSSVLAVTMSALPRERQILNVC
jgi:hypothetical protein